MVEVHRDGSSVEIVWAISPSDIKFFPCIHHARYGAIDHFADIMTNDFASMFPTSGSSGYYDICNMLHHNFRIDAYVWAATAKIVSWALMKRLSAWNCMSPFNVGNLIY
jgi:hypothetical protein